MPVKIDHNLPARETLEKENIFVMTDIRAEHQDIRPLEIVIVNLMPNKIQTETQLLRLLGNSPLQINITLVCMETHDSKNTKAEHLTNFYEGFAAIADKKFDGLIVTGAPVEQLEFEEVDYWPELSRILEWSKHNVFSTLYICWGSQAGLYYHYGIKKHNLHSKQFGVYKHHITATGSKLIAGIDEIFYAPHSRHTTNKKEEILTQPDLRIVAESPEAGVFLMESIDKRKVFITGHPEYDRLSLKAEYDRDRAKGLDIALPVGYFPNDDPSQEPCVTWRSAANIIYSNWLNYYVYQRTPYDLNELSHYEI